MMEMLLEEGMMRKIKMSICCRAVSSGQRVEQLIWYDDACAQMIGNGRYMSLKWKKRKLISKFNLCIIPTLSVLDVNQPTAVFSREKVQ